jgi:hypothetical protein
VIGLPALDAVDATVLVGVPAAVLLAVGLVLRDSRALGDRRPRRALGFELSLIMFGIALIAALVARFLLLT